MSTVDFLTRLRNLEVQLQVEDGRLRCTAPPGVLTAELKTELANRKGEIITFLTSVVGDERHRNRTIQRIPRGGDLPVSYGQQRLWFLDQLDPGSAAYNICAAVQLVGMLDTFALEKALAEIVRRHETLRASIVAADGEPHAVITPFAGWTLPSTDLEEIPAAERESAVERAASEEALRPFTLARGPLFRARLLRLAAREHVLLLAVHHIICDGWSLGVLVRELGTLYSAFVNGKDSPLAELPIQYTDFAQWQREWLEGPELKTQLSYWKYKLAGELPVLELPLDRMRPALQTFRGALTQRELDLELTNELRRIGREENATLFMVLLAGFAAFLSRYNGQEDIIVGSSSANRQRTAVEGLIGFFINNLVLRMDLSGNPTFREVLKRARQVALEANENQNVPFERLVELIQPERSLSHAPIFQVMLNLQNFPIKSLELPGVMLRPIPLRTETTRFDLNLDITETKRGLTLEAAYNTDLFDLETIDLLLMHFGKFLDKAVADPEIRIAELPLLTSVEERVLLKDWNATTVEYPRACAFPALFEAQVKRSPDAVAVIFGENQLSYGELNCRANQLANYLRKLGVGPEVLVGICVERSADMVVGLLGILKAGGAYVPLDPGYPKERLAFMLEDADVGVVVTEEGCRDRLPETTARVVSLDADCEVLGSESEENSESGVVPENLAYVIYTSGSTGKPKGVQIQHSALVNFLVSMRKEPGLGVGDRLLSVTTISFDISNLELYLPLIVGAQLIVASREETQDSRRLIKLLSEHAVSVMQATPATWRLLLDSGWRDGKGIKILCGGEALSRELADRLLATSAEVWNLYGPTETTIWSAASRVQEGIDVVPVGRPIANTRIYILDGGLHPVPVGVAGELYIGGDGLARGYLNRPELTTERFVSNPFSENARDRIYKTGDRARYRRDGTIECLGRLDHQIKLRGFRIELGEIESILASHPGVGQAVAVVREDVPGDQRLVAYWVATEDPSTIESTKLRRFLEERLPSYMVPSLFIELPKFPLTPNGKVDRARLPAPEGQRPTVESSYVSPRTEVERTLTDIWQEVLRVEKVGIQDNFFDLGGNSLLIVQLQSRVYKRLNREFPLVELFRRPTVNDFAEFLSQGESFPPSFASSKKRAKLQKAALRRS